jgi:hypothetical protein
MYIYVTKDIETYQKSNSCWEPKLTIQTCIFNLLCNYMSSRVTAYGLGDQFTSRNGSQDFSALWSNRLSIKCAPGDSFLVGKILHTLRFSFFLANIWFLWFSV